MDCERFPLTCSIDRLTEQVGAFDWLSAISTLLATLVGAAVALAGSAVLENRREKRQDVRERDLAKARIDAMYVERLDGLIFRLVEAIGDRLKELNHSVGKPTSPDDMLALADTLRIAARGEDDANAAKTLRYAIDRVGKLSRTDQLRDTRVVGQIIRAWREGSHDAVKAAERFEGVAP